MIIVSETIENCIYCRVVFEENGKSYYYLTDDEEIKPLDLVVVPVGIDGHENSTGDKSRKIYHTYCSVSFR